MNHDEKKILGENLKYLRGIKGWTQQNLADNLGINRQSIGSYEEARAMPKAATLKNIADIFEVSIESLLSIDLSDPETGKNGIIEFKRAQTSQKELNILPVSVDNEGVGYIDLIKSQKAAAGYLNGFSDPEYVEELPKMQLPMLGHGTYRAFEIKGDSMLPIQSGTIIVAEYVPDWRSLKNGHTYIIVSDNEGIVYKRVYSFVNEEGGYLLLYSDNISYDPFTIQISEVRQIWKAKMFLSDHFPDVEVTQESLLKQIVSLKKELTQLKASKYDD